MAGPRSLRTGAAVDDLAPQPVPQREPATPVVNVQVMNAFWQFLPAKATTFVDRIWFKNYPRPIFVGGLPPYPVPLDIISFGIPGNQAYVLKRFAFKVYQASGIGVDDITEVPQARVASYFGFQVAVGNRGIADFASNVTQRGQVVDYVPGKAGATTTPALPQQGSLFPFADGTEPVQEGFAVYGQPNQLITARVWVLREPPFDVRMLSFRTSGYNINSSLLDKILTALTPKPGT